MLASFSGVDQFEKVVCGKRCYNAILKAVRLETAALPLKRRFPWPNDGPDPSVSSLSVLIKWMTDGNNYDRYHGGEGQSGETKQTLAGEVVEAISASGVKTARAPKDVMNKISGLETSFREASDWRSNTGQGVENEADLRAAILHKCPSFYELHPIMDDSPSTHPLLLNTDQGFSYSDHGSESSSDGDNDIQNSEDVRQLTQGAAERNSRSPGEIATFGTGAATPTGTGTTASSSGTRQINRQSGKQGFAQLLHPPQKRKPNVDHQVLVSLKELVQQKEIELKKITIQRQGLQFRQHQSEKKEQEAEARITELNANTVKLQEEAEHWRTQRLVTLLRERKKNVKLTVLLKMKLTRFFHSPMLLRLAPDLQQVRQKLVASILPSSVSSDCHVQLVKRIKIVRGRTVPLHAIFPLLTS